jgi:hypothetical protein
LDSERSSLHKFNFRFVKYDFQSRRDATLVTQDAPSPEGTILLSVTQVSSLRDYAAAF